MVVDVTRGADPARRAGPPGAGRLGTRLKEYPDVYIRTVALTPPIYNPLRANRRFRRLWKKAIRSLS